MSAPDWSTQGAHLPASHGASPLPHDGRVRRRLHLVALVLVLLAELPILIPPPFGLTDHLLFWYAGHLAVTGGSPYDIAAWTEAQRAYSSAHLSQFLERGDPVWVYPAWSVLLFMPFGLLPYPAGAWALYLAYVGVGLFAAILFIRSLPPRWQPGAELAIVLVAMFQPLVIANRYGQFGSFLLLGLVLVFIGLRDRRALPFVAGALVLFVKPQLFLVVVPVALVLLIRARAWRIIGITAPTLLLIAVGATIRYPESLAFFRRGAADRADVFTIYSTTWAFAHFIAPALWVPVAIAFVALASIATIAAIRRLPADLRLAGIVAGATLLSLVIAPVAFHYDQVVLVLPVVLAVAVGRRPYQIATTWAVAAVAPWFVFFSELSLGGPDSQSLSGVVPLLVAPLLWLATRSPSPAITASSPAIASTPANAK
jgi:hypothetical protein